MNFILCIFALLISLSIGFGYYKSNKYSVFEKKIKYYKINSIYDGSPCDTEYYRDDDSDKPLYIVIWKETKKTEDLITEMEKQGLKTIFISENIYGYIQLTTDEMPLVYKDEVLLETWMDIYTEIYPM
jgi:hypothetical protein